VLVADEPPTDLVVWWQRLAVTVSVIQPGDATAGAVAQSLHGAPDLILFWDVDNRHVLAHLRALAPSACSEVAVWRLTSKHRGVLRDVFAAADLRRHGWLRLDRFYPWPDVQRPRQLIEHDAWTHTRLLAHRRSQTGWKSSMLQSMRQSPLGRLLAPAALSRWSRGATPAEPARLQRIVEQASSTLGTSLRGAGVLLSPNGVAIVRLQKVGAEPVGILKIPLVESTIERVATNARALVWMQSQRASIGNWSDAAPHLLAAETTDGCSWTLEEHVVGSEAQTWESAPATQATQHLAELLGHYQRSATVSTDIAELQVRLQSQVDKVCALLSSDLAQALQEIWRRTVRNLEGVRIPLLPQHGDCKLENVLGDPRRPTELRLLDWELWKPDGLPLLDLLHLLLSRRRRLGGYSIGGSICRWLLTGDFAPWERHLIEGLSQRLDRDYVRATPVLYWLERIAPIAERGAWPHDGWAQANVEQVIERMKHRQAEVLA
jgi:hypothetical protein